MALIFVLIPLLIFTISIVYFSIQTGISPMPSSLEVKKALIPLLPQKIDGKIYELGSGWGSILVQFVNQYPKAEIVGYELSFFPWLTAWLRLKWLGGVKAQVLRKDFFSTKLENATLVFCYLYPGAMDKLKEKFENELSRGSIVVTNSFTIPGWKPLMTIAVNDLFRSKIYYYKKN